ncbi:ketoacyl-ACP synthase III [Pendulispora albinea]|uniref:Ketoacyl-ACP synthase III n=1 Tax=Pendulispora albinea TaxID=2741071 RepID=A0ABZ2MAQ4_9BACT
MVERTGLRSTSPHDGARLAAIGTYIPPRRLSNLERAAHFDLDAEFLRKRLGVLERSVKEPSEVTSDLCLRAFDDLTKKTRIDLDVVRLVCVVTQNPDRRIPHVAAILHHKLGMPKSCMTFDVSHGCAGYPHAVAIVSSLLDTFGFRDALLFTGDPYSDFVDPEDKTTALIFSDAATVSYISRDRPGYVLIDGDFGTVPGSSTCLDDHDGRLFMDGRLVFSNAAREVPPSVQRVLARNALTTADVGCFFLHPGSKYVVDFLRGTLSLPPEKVPFVIEGYGNTISSSIPLTIEEHLRRASTPPPARVVMSGFGVGFTWGTTLMEYRTQRSKNDE